MLPLGFRVRFELPVSTGVMVSFKSGRLFLKGDEFDIIGVRGRGEWPLVISSVGFGVENKLAPSHPLPFKI